MALTVVNVTGHYVNADGTNAAGQVVFELNEDLLDGAGNVIVPRTKIYQPLIGGQFATPLYATDDTTTAPTGATYRVTEEINGAPPFYYDIQVPHTSGGLDLADVAPAVTSPQFSYTLLSTFNAHAADPTAHSGGGGTYPVLLQAPSDVVTLIVKGKIAPTQTAHLTEWQLNDGTVKTYVDVNGRISSNTSGSYVLSPGTTPQNLFVSAAVGNVPVVLKGFASQTGDLLQAQDSTAAVVARITASGIIDSAIGYRIAGAAASGQFLRGNGTNFVSSAIQAGDISGTFASTSAANTFLLGPNIFNSGGVGIIPLAAVGAASQTADLLQVRNSGGTILNRVTAAGYVSIHAGSPLAKLHVQGSVAADRVVLVQAAASQTGDYLALYDGSSVHTIFDYLGRLGFLGGGTASSVIKVSGTYPGTEASVYGVNVDYTVPATSTSDVSGIRTRVKTAASAFTVANGYGFYIDSPSVGATSAVTTMHGAKFFNQGASGITNAYGIWVAPQSGASSVNIGARIDTATQAALWLGGDTNSTTVAGGIAFGSGRDVTLFRSSATTLMSNVALATRRNTVPADADLSAGDMSIWYDSTNGASKLMVKAKQADGTVKTASVALA